MITALFLLLVAFIVIWLSAGLAIQSVERLSTRLRLSKFTLSLFVLGTVTSFPEMAVVANSTILGAPNVGLGNLIGGQIFLLFLVIPLLGLVSNGLKLKAQMQNTSLVLTLLVALIPMVALIDQRIELSEALVILGAYIIFVVSFARQSSLLERISQKIQQPRKVAFGVELVKLAIAIGILLLASNTAVREIINLSALLGIPRFLMSILILPIGTNLPELSLALKGILQRKQDVALGDYMGSLTFNSLLIVVLTLAYGGSISVGQNITPLIVFFVISLFVFWLSCRSRKTLSVLESLALLVMFGGFAVLISFLGLESFLH